MIVMNLDHVFSQIRNFMIVMASDRNHASAPSLDFLNVADRIITDLEYDYPHKFQL